jgi:hypothetical protein
MLPSIENSVPYFNPLYRRPDLYDQMSYISKLGLKIGIRILGRIVLAKRYRWGVAYYPGDWRFLAMWRAKKINNPPHHFLADPFVITEGNVTYCFVEDFDYQLSKGCISVYRLTEKNAERLGEAINEPFHMSFPYLFRYDSKIYMCPETIENKDIRLYECMNFPLEWKLVKVVMPNVEAVDTMIFENEGIWWLFTNMDPSNVGDTGDRCSELFAYYADSPLSDKWYPHPKNPILIDSTKGRNGGLLRDDKYIYRVAQRQGHDVYGKGFSINKILKLNKDEYIETEICAVEPNFFKNLQGTHHLHSDGIVSVFDYAERKRVSN